MLYLAIDQHSKQLTVNVRDEAGQVLRRKQVSTRGSAPYDFLTQLSAEAGDAGYATIVEVCGFNDWLLDQLPNYGCREIVLVQPDKRPTRKTDHRDANQLGEILWVNRQRLLTKTRVQGLRRVHIPTPQERDDRRVAALRHRNGRETTRVINSVRTILRRRNLQHDCPTKTIQAKRARVWLDQLELAPLDRLELNQLLARWDQLVAQRRTRSGHRRTRGAMRRAQLLRTLPSVGPFMALGLWAYIGDIALRTPTKSGELLGTHARLPQLRRKRTTPGRHHQARQHAGPVPARPTRDVRAQTRWQVASLVSQHQASPRREDRARGRDAALGHDHLAHAHASRGLCRRGTHPRPARSHHDYHVARRTLCGHAAGEGTSRTPSSLPPHPHPPSPLL